MTDTYRAVKQPGIGRIFLGIGILVGVLVHVTVNPFDLTGTISPEAFCEWQNDTDKSVCVRALDAADEP